jgi:hypothetical protein
MDARERRMMADDLAQILSRQPMEKQGIASLTEMDFTRVAVMAWRLIVNRVEREEDQHGRAA